MRTWFALLFAAWGELALGCKAYSFQTFSVGQVLTAAQMNQVEVNIRDHQHGVSGVSIPVTAARSSNTILAGADVGKTIVATSTFTQTLTAAATLGDGWYCDYRNDGTGIITFDPNGAELINGAATLAIYPGEACRIVCDGAAFKALFLSTGPVLISTGTASSSSSLDFTGLTGFSSYEFEIEGLVAGTNNTTLYAQISEDNGSTWKSGGTDYRYAAWAINGSGGSGADASNAFSAITLMQTISSSASAPVSGRLTLHNPAQANVFKMMEWALIGYLNGGVTQYQTGGGHYVTDTNTINGVRFSMSSGNIGSAIIKCFGVRG